MNLEPCGLFIGATYQYLEASSDGLVGEDAIVEIKCPMNLRSYATISDTVADKKLPHLISKDKRMSLKQAHSYYCKVQGQLHVANKMQCIFITWSPEEL